MTAVYAEDLGDGVRALVLNQPRKRNAISAPMMDLLADLLRAADADPDVRVVVLRGEGEHFSSGGDLTQSGPGEQTVEAAEIHERAEIGDVLDRAGDEIAFLDRVEQALLGLLALRLDELAA